MNTFSSADSTFYASMQHIVLNFAKLHTIELQLNHKSSVLFDVISWPGSDELVVNCTNIMMYVRLQTIINMFMSMGRQVGWNKNLTSFTSTNGKLR